MFTDVSFFYISQLPQGGQALLFNGEKRIGRNIFHKILPTDFDGIASLTVLGAEVMTRARGRLAPQQGLACFCG